MTTHLNTSRWHLSVGRPANTAACIWDGTALQASWLFLFPRSVSFEHSAPYGTDASILNILVQQTDLFNLFNKAARSEERDRTSLLIYLGFHLKQQEKMSKYAIIEQTNAQQGQVAALQKPFQETYRSNICICRGEIGFHSVSATELLQLQVVRFLAFGACCHGCIVMEQEASKNVLSHQTLA